MKEQKKEMPLSMGFESDDDQRKGYRTLSTSNGVAPGDSGEYEYKPGSTNNDSRVSMIDEEAAARKAAKKASK